MKVRKQEEIVLRWVYSIFIVCWQYFISM